MSTAAPTAKPRHPAGTPAPASRIKRLRNHKAHHAATVTELGYHLWRIGIFYTKRPHLALAAGWRNKDRTCLALIPLVFLIAGWLWAVPAVILAVVGWDRYRPRCHNRRQLTIEQRQLGRALIVAPPVLGLRDCHSPHRPARQRGNKIHIAGTVIENAWLAQLADRIRPLAHRPELVARYLTLRVSPGLAPDVYQSMQDVLANRYDKWLDFTRAGPSTVTMRIQHVDWLARIAPWEKAQHQTPTRILVGYNRDAQPVYDSIADQAWLIAGVRGSGKSAFLRGICGRLYDIPGVELWPGDHLGDLRDFRRHSKRYAATLTDTLRLLDDFVACHTAAYTTLERHDLKALTWPEHPCRVLILDELGALTLHPDKEIREHVLDCLYIIATQGRKTQHSLIAATQHPDAGVLPTRIRGQFTRRLGLRCGDRAEAAMIFGKDAPPLSTIPANHPGRGWWGDDRPIQLRTPGLYDDDLSWLVGDGKPPGNHGRSWERDVIDVEESAGIPGTAPPLPPLHLVPALVENDLSDEDRLWKVLEAAPPRGYEVKDLCKLTGIAPSTMYRWLQPGRLPWVQTVQSVQPKRYRLSPAARRTG